MKQEPGCPGSLSVFGGIRCHLSEGLWVSLEVTGGHQNGSRVVESPRRGGAGFGRIAAALTFSSERV